ncbi:MAG: hypothetical protein IJ181_04460 [Acidaminococcaceae bacterium]|nr:hypothetical protein [Acidaminococcaceae bacterium]
MTSTKVFQNGNSQAIRIPQEMRTTDKEFFIAKVGNVFIAYPADNPWLPTRQAIGAFSEDFMNERKQPSWDEVPSREAL